MTQFFKQYHSIKPYLINDEPAPEKERLQSPEDRNKLDGLYECILCACCTSQCPSSWWNPDKFVGPAGLLQAERFIVDSRDRATQERLDDLDDVYRLFRCRSIMNCTEVCPKGLAPSRAIEQIRLRMVRDSFSGTPVTIRLVINVGGICGVECPLTHYRMPVSGGPICLQWVDCGPRQYSTTTRRS